MVKLKGALDFGIILNCFRNNQKKLSVVDAIDGRRYDSRDSGESYVDVLTPINVRLSSHSRIVGHDLLDPSSTLHPITISLDSIEFIGQLILKLPPNVKNPESQKTIKQTMIEFFRRHPRIPEAGVLSQAPELKEKFKDLIEKINLNRNGLKQLE